MITRRPSNQGFTIIEMSIALAFLSILLIAILTLTISAGKLYVKGVTNKTLNQTGRDIQETIRRDFLASSASDIGIVIPEGGATKTGRICLGSVTYLWNTAAIINDTTSNGSTYRITQGASAASSLPLHFARVADPGGALCVKQTGNKYIRYIAAGSGSYRGTKYAELLGGTGRDFALYSMDITQLASKDKRGLYRLHYTIGTYDTNTTESTGSFVACKPPAATTANFNYCAVADFDMIVRVGGGAN